MQILHNGVNLQQFAPAPPLGFAMRRFLGIGDEKVILYVGRVCKQKGTDLLIDAYLRIKRQFEGVRLVVAGPAEEFGKSGGTDLTRCITQSGGIYLGAAQEEELASIYNLADVFVMPTRDIEMFGMAAVEAQACGKPVVASHHGGLPEVISNRSGRFFPVGDADALASVLLDLLRNPMLCRRLGAAARGNAAQFAWPRIAHTLDALLSQEPTPKACSTI
jgi:phosphatidyl-myo-inositol alpha-mannosyltransferase